ncbi:MAG: hypothetical protein ABI707_12915 [Ferruginibacter sp.]
MLPGDLASALNIPFHGDDFLLLTLPADKGMVWILNLLEVLPVMRVDASFGQKLRIERNHSTIRYFILLFDDLYKTDV